MIDLPTDLDLIGLSFWISSNSHEKSFHHLST